MCPPTAAALGGHLETLRWARERGCPWDRTACLWHAKQLHSAEVIAYIEAQPE